MLDFTGGVFSLSQQVIDTVGRGKGFFAETSGGFNIVKFLLAIISLIFDIIFLVQHYILYADKWKYKDATEEKLKIQQKYKAMNESEKDKKRFIGGNE